MPAPRFTSARTRQALDETFAFLGVLLVLLVALLAMSLAGIDVIHVLETGIAWIAELIRGVWGLIVDAPHAIRSAIAG
jgi:hypothetical protein